MSFLSYFIPQVIARSSSQYNKKIEVREVNGRNTLLVNGIEQTGRYTEKLWIEGLRNIQAKHILVLGVGGGTVFQFFPHAHITAVDIDDEIIKIAQKYFGVRNVDFIKSNARTFVTNKRFDLIIVDLYIGNDVPDFVSKKPFLMKLQHMLAAKGRIIINYYSERDQAKKAGELVKLLGKGTVKPVLRNMFIYVLK